MTATIDHENLYTLYEAAKLLNITPEVRGRLADRLYHTSRYVRLGHTYFYTLDDVAAARAEDAAERRPYEHIDYSATEPCPFCGAETLRLWFVDSCQACGAELDKLRRQVDEWRAGARRAA